MVRRGSGLFLDSPFALRSAFSLAAAPAPAKAAWSCFTASTHLKATTARTATERAASRPALALAVGPGAAPSPRQRLRRFPGCSCATSTSIEQHAGQVHAQRGDAWRAGGAEYVGQQRRDASVAKIFVKSVVKFLGEFVVEFFHRVLHQVHHSQLLPSGNTSSLSIALPPS